MSINSIDSKNQDEKSIFDHLLYSIKTSIYSYLSPVVDYEISSIYFKLLIMIIELFQVLDFFVEPELQILWNSSFAKNLKNFFSFFLILPYLEKTNYQIYLTILYLSISFIVITVICGFYISLDFKKKKEITSHLLIKILRIFGDILPHILFQPILTLFLSIFECDNQNMTKTMKIFPEIVCFQGDHLIHCLVAAFGSVILFIMTCINTLCCHQIREISLTSKLTGRLDFLFMLFKTFNILLITLLDPDQNIIFVAVYSAGFVGFFNIFNSSLVYFDTKLTKMISIQQGIYAWSGIMLVLCKCLYDDLFDANIYLWFVGIFYVIIIVICRQRMNFHYLLLDVNDFANEKIAVDCFDYFSILLLNYKKQKTIEIFLEGFLEYHKTNCYDSECPVFKNYALKSNKYLNIKDNDVISILKLTYLQNSIFLLALQRFPNSTIIRIKYSIFLMDRLGQKQTALQEILNAENNNLAFDLEFNVFKLKSFIEMELYNEKKINNKTNFNEIILNDTIKEIKQNIEKSINLHLEFWMILAEDMPNLTKLKTIGFKITSTITKIEKNFKFLQSMSLIIPKIMLLYAKYLKIIINDTELSQQILDKLKKTSILPVDSTLSVYLSEYFNDSTASIIISGEDKNMGYITKISLSMTSFLGYDKTELLGKKINVIMPNIYSSKHDSFLENYASTLEPQILNKEIEIPIKLKSNYIKKVHLTVKIYNTILQGSQFLGIFKIDRNTNVCFILIDIDGNLQEFSSNCLNILGIDKKKISKSKIDITHIIPDFFDNLNLYKTKQGQQALISLFEVPIKGKENIETTVHFTHMNVSVNDIKFKSYGNVGYFVKLQQNIETLQNKKVKKNKIDSDTGFQFEYEPITKTYIGNYTNNIISLNNPQESLIAVPNEIVINSLEKENDSKLLDLLETNQIKSVTDIVNTNIKNYGIGIKTMRLLKDKIFDLEDLKREEEDDEEREEEEKKEEELKILNEEEEENNIIVDKDNCFASRKNLNTFLNNEKFKKFQIVNKLKYASIILIISILCIGIISFILIENQFELENNFYEIFILSNQRISECLTILNIVNRIFLINKGIINFDQTDILKNELDKSVITLATIENKLQIADYLNSIEIEKLNFTVTLQENSNFQKKKFFIEEIINQIISKAFDISNSNFSNINENNSNYYFLNENLMSNLYYDLKNTNDFLINHYIDSFDNIENYNYIILISSSLIILICLTSIFILYYLIMKFQIVIIQIFLNISLEKVKKKVEEVEEFFANYSLGEFNDDDDTSNKGFNTNENYFEDDEESKIKFKRKRRKKFKIKTNQYKINFLFFFIFTAILELYFIGNFVLVDNYSSYLKSYVSPINTTAMSKPFFSFYNNYLRYNLMNIDNKDDISEKIELLYATLGKIEEEQYFNNKNNDYDIFFEKCFKIDICLIITKFPECKDFDNGILSQGMTLTLTRFIENLRNINQLKEIIKNQVFNLSNLNISTKNIYPDNKIKNQMINLFFFDLVQINNDLQEKYINSAFDEITNKFLIILQDENNKAKQQRVFLFIAFIFSIILIYLIFWIPMISNINQETINLNKILLIIPTKFINENSFLRDSFKKILKIGK